MKILWLIWNFGTYSLPKIIVCRIRSFRIISTVLPSVNFLLLANLKFYFLCLYREALLSYLLCSDDKLVMASLCLLVSFLQNEGISLAVFQIFN